MSYFVTQWLALIPIVCFHRGFHSYMAEILLPGEARSLTEKVFFIVLNLFILVQEAKQTVHNAAIQSTNTWTNRECLHFDTTKNLMAFF